MSHRSRSLAASSWTTSTNFNKPHAWMHYCSWIRSWSLKRTALEQKSQYILTHQESIALTIRYWLMAKNEKKIGVEDAVGSLNKWHKWFANWGMRRVTAGNPFLSVLCSEWPPCSHSLSRPKVASVDAWMVLIGNQSLLELWKSCMSVTSDHSEPLMQISFIFEWFSWT